MLGSTWFGNNFFEKYLDFMVGIQCVWFSFLQMGRNFSFLLREVATGVGESVWSWRPVEIGSL